MRAQQTVDVILMDVQMPGMDGFEAAARIRQIPGCDEIPILFVSAVYTEDPSVKKGYQVGGLDYFTKPFDPELIRRKVAVYATFRRRLEFLRHRATHLHESEALARTGRKLGTLLRSLPTGILIANTEGEIVQVTEAAFHILGLGEQTNAYTELLRWWEANGRTFRDKPGPLARALDAGETTRSQRLPIRCPDGIAKTLLVAASPLLALDGTKVGGAVLIQDVGETELLEEALELHASRLLTLGAELETNTEAP
jgi:PAS domain-containing protein